MGSYLNAVGIHATDDISKNDSFIAMLIEKGVENCRLRRVRIENDQVFIVSPSWPHEEVPSPLDHFQTIKRVLRIDHR